jgi:hypothetical protein
VCEAAVLKQQRARLYQAWRISAAGADRHLENDADLLVSNSRSESMQPHQSSINNNRDQTRCRRFEIPVNDSEHRFVTNVTT